MFTGEEKAEVQEMVSALARQNNKAPEGTPA